MSPLGNLPHLNWSGGALPAVVYCASGVSSVKKMAHWVAPAETRLSRAEVLLVASLRDIAHESQTGISRILYFLPGNSLIFLKGGPDQDCGLLSLKRW